MFRNTELYIWGNFDFKQIQYPGTDKDGETSLSISLQRQLKKYVCQTLL